jgi:hypothetical protein
MISYVCDILRRFFTGTSITIEIGSHIPVIPQTHIDIEKAYIEACAAASTDLEGIPLSPLIELPKALENLSQQPWVDMAKHINIPHLDDYTHVVQKDASQPKVL